MHASAYNHTEAVRLFGLRKNASLGSILPTVAGPIIGGYAGRALGQRLFKGNPTAGEMLGTITGMTAGRYLGDEVLAPRAEEQASVPPGAPYAMDPSTQEIPPWALMGARFLHPTMDKFSSDRIQDVILGEIPGYSAVEGYRQGGIPGAVKGTLGQVGGGLAGGAVGYGTGLLLKHLLGRDPNIPLINFPLSHLFAGLGATMGATKGFQLGAGTPH